jgi:hypothetical protein
MSERIVGERDLAALAKKLRIAAKKTRTEAARDMGIKHPSIFHAEESPRLSYTKLRCKMIEAYSDFKVSGPFFKLESKR